jgi:hypothetical protein
MRIDTGVWRSALIAMLVMWMSCTGAWAQPDAEIPYFKGTYDEAVQASKDQHRFLLLYPLNGRWKEFEEYTLKNRSLRHWIEWHAILYRIDPKEDPALWSDVARRIRMHGKRADPGKNPHFLVVRRGIDDRVVPFVLLHMDPAFTPPDRPIIGSGPLNYLLQLDEIRNGLISRDPSWLMLHENKNPPPAAPERVYFAPGGDGNANACDGPEEGESVFGLWARAREQAALGNDREAMGIYTWLWERLGDGRSWTSPLRRLVLPGEMRESAARYRPAKARVNAMANEHYDRYEWMDFPERLDWIIITEAAENEFQILFELDYSMNDSNEGSLLTRTERSGVSLLIERSPWSEIGRVVSEDLSRLERLRAGLNDPAPPTATDEEWSHVLALRTEVLLLETCRVHVASLGDGRVDEAMRVVEPLLKVDTDGSARLALAAVAWGAGVADARHGAWVAEAVEMGADDAGLGEAISAKNRQELDRGASTASPMP